MAINAINAQRSEVYSNFYLSDKNIGYFRKLEMRCFLPDDHYKIRILRDGEISSYFLNFPRGIFCHLKQMPQMCCNLSGATCPGQGKIPTVKTNSTPVMKNRIMFESWLFVTNGVSVIGNIKNLHITDVTNYGMWVFLGNQIRFIRQ